MSSGTWRRLTRMRVQVEERPRMESTRMSSTARCAAAAGCLLSSVRGRLRRRVCLELAMVSRGFEVRRRACDRGEFAASGRSEASSCLRAWLRKRCAPKPSPIWPENFLALRGCDSRRFSLGAAKVRRPGGIAEALGFILGGEFQELFKRTGAASMSACGSPIVAKRWGTVKMVKSAGSQSGTSRQSRGVETRASGSGRTE